jgi:hypothetical protein
LESALFYEEKDTVPLVRILHKGDTCSVILSAAKNLGYLEGDGDPSLRSG